MQIHQLIALVLGLLLSSNLLAHGQHATMPFASLWHLLAHHWPLLLIASLLISAIVWLPKQLQRLSHGTKR